MSGVTSHACMYNAPVNQGAMMAIGSSGRAVEAGVASLTVGTVMNLKRVITGDH